MRINRQIEVAGGSAPEHETSGIFRGNALDRSARCSRSPIGLGRDLAVSPGVAIGVTPSSEVNRLRWEPPRGGVRGGTQRLSKYAPVHRIVQQFVDAAVEIAELFRETDDISKQPIEHIVAGMFTPLFPITPSHRIDVRCPKPMLEPISSLELFGEPVGCSAVAEDLGPFRGITMQSLNSLHLATDGLELISLLGRHPSKRVSMWVPSTHQFDRLVLDVEHSDAGSKTLLSRQIHTSRDASRHHLAASGYIVRFIVGRTTIPTFESTHTEQV